MGYTEQGEPCEVYFTRSGSAEDYYAPGTYIKISMSKTITLGVEVVEEPFCSADSVGENSRVGNQS